MIIAVVCVVSAGSWAATTTRVSVANDGTQGNSNPERPAISGDGRYVAFESYADNLVPGDTNNMTDVFVHDRQTGQTTRVSVASDGSEGNFASSYPSISADGQYVVFHSWADNLVPGDTNVKQDIFVHNRSTGQTTRVSLSSTGVEGNGTSIRPTISGDGRYVTFISTATNLVAGDTNNRWDVFVHDRNDGTTTRVSVDSTGNQSNGDSWFTSISSDGRMVAFLSEASNLVPWDTNGQQDIFVHDRNTGATIRASENSDGTQADRGSGALAMSGDGR